MATDMRRFVTFTSILVALLMSACGGGGGGGTGAPGSGQGLQERALESWQAFLRGNRTFVVIGYGVTNPTTLLLDTVEVTYSYSAREQVVSAVDGNVHWRMRIATSSRFFGTPDVVRPGGWADIFFDDVFRVIGFANSEGNCSRAINAQVPPAGASFPQRGTLFEGILTPPCFVPGALSSTAAGATWSAEAEANIAFFCVTLSSLTPTGDVIPTNSLCFESASGGELGLRAMVRVLGGEAIETWRNYPSP